MLILAESLRTTANDELEGKTMAAGPSERRATPDVSDAATTVRIGALWGIVGAVVMAMYAMIAGATYLDSGFFTPLYHIGSTLIAPRTMMTSMERAISDQDFYFSFGPALLGLIVHLAVGAAFGIVFALIARALNVRGVASIVAGCLFGVVVMLFSSFVGLPIAATLFGGGMPISDMPEMVGWTTFTIEHLMYGFAVGAGWFLANRERERRSAAFAT
jgi:hypothetical protein